ncbi:hypothetical protein WNB94_03185 [Aquabacterium sp. A3]|uniref:hypothetical protein n=1 Tax=Aquabacterium sp. A3 TaxID=3132829 RepID=UPI00311947C2
MRKLRVIAAAVALMAASGSASAFSSASASISSVTLKLIDLTPDDGVAPSFSFIDGENVTVIDGWVDDDSRETPGIVRTDEVLAGWLSASSGVATTPAGNATATWATTSDSMTLSAIAMGPGGEYNWNMSTGPESSGEYWLRNIQLSANSYLAIELAYSLDVEASNAIPCLANTFCSNAPLLELAGASAGMSLAYSYSDDGLSVSYNRSAYADSLLAIAQPAVQAGSAYIDAGMIKFHEFDQPGVDEAFHEDGVLRLAFVNASDSDQTARLRVGMSIWGQGATPAIPEASTFVLYSVGLLALLGAVRRRRLGETASN